jgi:hypothetical protein
MFALRQKPIGFATEGSLLARCINCNYEFQIEITLDRFSLLKIDDLQSLIKEKSVQR